MTALSADPVSPRKATVGESDNRLIVNTEVMYKDALTALGTPTHGTTASRGLVEAWAASEGQFLCGRWGQGATTGNTGAAVLTHGQVQIDDQVVGPVAVAGLASSSFQADCLKYVYAPDDNMPASLTLTRPAVPNQTPVGIVWKGVSATQCYVLMFGFRTRLLLDMQGGPVRTVCIGNVGVGITGSGTLLTGIKMHGHGRISDTFAICTVGPTGADVDIDLNLEIDGTNVTGGVIECITADVAGDKKAGTAITESTSEFHHGDLLDREGTVNTAGTAADPGSYAVYITVEYLPGL